MRDTVTIEVPAEYAQLVCIHLANCEIRRGLAMLPPAAELSDEERGALHEALADVREAAVDLRRTLANRHHRVGAMSTKIAQERSREALFRIRTAHQTAVHEAFMAGALDGRLSEALADIREALALG